MTEPTKVIELVDVVKSFGRQRVLDGVNLSVEQGETLVIVGASGQGKSVMLKHMLGLHRPDSGRVMMFGRDLALLRGRELRETRQNFGVLFQGTALLDSLTVFDNVALPLRERTDYPEERIRDIVHDRLAMVDLEDIDEKYPAQVSGGMRKRVGLARALALEPKIVFFDEPTTGLDVHKSNEIYRVFRATQERLGYTAVIVSHDVPKILKLADRVALLAEGTVQACVSPEEFQLSDHPVVRAFVETTMGSIYRSDLEEVAFHETF
jgi:phospholipid/cholesterol/gamma-HCH transport system ATP-binding protein